MAIVNTYHRSIPSQNGKSSLLAVLTEDAAGQWAVYIGIVDLPEAGTPDYQEARMNAAHWVHGNGEKQDYRRALHYFVNIPEERYRV